MLDSFVDESELFDASFEILRYLKRVIWHQSQTTIDMCQCLYNLIPPQQRHVVMYVIMQFKLLSVLKEIV